MEAGRGDHAYGLVRLARVEDGATPALTPDEVRRRVGEGRVATLATIGAMGPDLVPLTYALVGDTVVSAVDHKPKTTRDLKRLQNIEDDPTVTLLVHRYDEDWATLWWCRARGHARIIDEGPEFEDAVDRLVEKYPQYRNQRPAGPVMAIDVTEWAGWSATKHGGGE